MFSAGIDVETNKEKRSLYTIQHGRNQKDELMD